MGTSSGTQTTQQQSQSSPWARAQPALTSILSNISGLQGQSGINTTENAAIQQAITNAGGINNLAPQFQQQALAFGGGDPFNTIQPAYQGYGNLLASAGITNPASLNPLNTPGLSNALNTVNQDITNQIQGLFAGAGRTGSGMDTQTLARGLSQGEGQLLTNQYNQNVQNLMNAGNNLFTAGIGTNTALGNNVTTGANLAGSIPNLAEQGPGAQLSAGQIPFLLQAGNQGQLANLAVPIAGLGGQTSSQGQTNTSYSPSPFAMGVSGAGLFGGGTNSAASGILGLFGL